MRTPLSHLVLIVAAIMCISVGPLAGKIKFFIVWVA